jgi:redox-sensing transcriptional repressor
MGNNQHNHNSKEISPAVVNRLPRYYRYLGDLLRDNITKISSKDLSEMMNVTASQIRQDLNCFGEFGHQGYGYNVRKLHDEVGRILGVERRFIAVVAGAGNLGRTLSKSGLFVKRGVDLKALFDINPEIIGMEIAGLQVLDVKYMAGFCRDNNIDIAVLTLPKEETEHAANILAEAGVKGFWNFSNMEIKLGDSAAIVENMHMGDSLMTLFYNLNK